MNSNNFFTSEYEFKEGSLREISHAFETTAEKHVDSINRGREYLKKYDLVWVVVRQSIEVLKMPESDEKASVTTWAGIERHGLYPRRFIIKSSGGEIIVRASSVWALMNFKTRTMTQDPDLIDRSTMVEDYDGGIKDPVSRIAFPKDRDYGSFEHFTTKDEIDNNNHVNNSIYFDWIDRMILSRQFAAEADSSGVAFSERWHKREYLKDGLLVWIEYSKEIHDNQTVRLEYTFDENRRLLIRGISNNEVCFTAALSY